MTPNPTAIVRALSRSILRNRHTRIMMDYYKEKLPRIDIPDSAAEWKARTTKIRKDLIRKVFLKGHRPGIINAPPVVQWQGVIETGKGYRIRKLRYEGYPGMWIPALLYEPTNLRGRVPAVLNPNGHHRGGKAMPYKQARCINLAKRGMLALNTEFIGMGELQGTPSHQHQAYLDLCGVAGVGTMYLAMKRGLDVLLAHRNADPDRIAMTGLSGGGWQTAVLSAIDDRIKAVVPVSGHSPIWHRATKRWQDHGDLEQTPVDLCTVTDYDTMTAMFAPRPALLIHSCQDSIFRPEFMRPALYVPARKVYRLLGVEDRVGFYANEEPGTHNYDRDNREQLYKFLKRSWNLDTPEEDIPCDDEILSEWELSVGLPEDNPTLADLASRLAGPLPRVRSSPKTRTSDRKRLKEVLRLPAEYRLRPNVVASTRIGGGVSVRHHCLEMDRWYVPVTEFRAGRSRQLVLILPEGKRDNAVAAVRNALAAGKRVFVADLFAQGEQILAGGAYHYLFMECISAGGDRPLGICAAQVLSLAKWLRSLTGNSKVDIVAPGLSTGLSALCAAALRPGGVGSAHLNLPDSLRRLIDWQVDYVQQPVPFCFGLLEQFDIEDLISLAHPAEIVMEGRDPMR